MYFQVARSVESWQEFKNEGSYTKFSGQAELPGLQSISLYTCFWNDYENYRIIYIVNNLAEEYCQP